MVFRLYRWLHTIARRALILLAVLILATAICGWFGFREADPKMTGSTVLFCIVNLYGLNGDNLQQNVNGWLDAARWFGCGVWAWAIAAVVVRLFRQPLLRMLVASRWCRAHVVLAGLGRDGDQLVARLCDAGHNVVVLEKDTEHPGIDGCRTAGALILEGMATSGADLRLASLGRAAYLLALSGDDCHNVHSAVTARQLLNRGATNQAPVVSGQAASAPRLRCTVQVAEPRLMEVLGDHPYARAPAETFELSILNRHEIMARAMWREATRDIAADALRRIMVVGAGSGRRLGECLITRAVKDWFIEHDGAPDMPRLEIHLYERDADIWVEHLRAHWPEVAHITPHNCWPEHYGGHDLVAGGLGECRIDAAFVCLEEEEAALALARRLRCVLPAEVPIVVQVQQRRAGLDAWLRCVGGQLPNVLTIGIFDRILDPHLVLDPYQEELAQALHQDYLALVRSKIAAARADGDDGEVRKNAEKPAFVAWDDLTPDNQESNRALARRLRQLIAGMQGERTTQLIYTPHELIDPIASWHLSEEQVEQLARKEHDDWCQYQLQNGWRAGLERDEAAKIHPDLKPWDQLKKDTRDFDLNIIRRLPYVFAKADYRLAHNAHER